MKHEQHCMNEWKTEWVKQNLRETLTRVLEFSYHYYLNYTNTTEEKQTPDSTERFHWALAIAQGSLNFSSCTTSSS